MERCHCNFKSERVCNTAAEIECANKANSEFPRVKLEICSESICPTQCETTTYSLFSSLSGYPTDAHLDLLLNKSTLLKAKYPNQTAVDRTRLKNNLMKLEVYYEELKVTTITQIAKTSGIDLISSIGGLMGMCLGASFLSIVEYFEFFSILAGGLLVKRTKVKSSNNL